MTTSLLTKPALPSPRSQPVFVYIPCGAELRGGAWVVVDSQINPVAVEMYADPGARGGVLEPEGIVEIKFREGELVRAMHRWVWWWQGWGQCVHTGGSCKPLTQPARSCRCGEPRRCLTLRATLLTLPACHPP